MLFWKATCNCVWSPEHDWIGWQKATVASTGLIIHLGREHYGKMRGKTVNGFVVRSRVVLVLIVTTRTSY